MSTRKGFSDVSDADCMLVYFYFVASICVSCAQPLIHYMRILASYLYFVSYTRERWFVLLFVFFFFFYLKIFFFFFVYNFKVLLLLPFLFIIVFAFGIFIRSTHEMHLIRSVCFALRALLFNLSVRYSDISIFIHIFPLTDYCFTWITNIETETERTEKENDNEDKVFDEKLKN